MNEDRDLEAWKRSRASVDVPADFADRVMSAVAREAAGAPRRGSRTLAALEALDRSPVGRAAALLVAGALFLARLAVLFAVFATP
jgi:hypothetical protein